MRYHLLIVIFLTGWLVQAQGFRTRYYEPAAKDNVAKAVFEISPGNYIAGGMVFENFSGHIINRLCIRGLNSHGQVLWTKKYGNEAFEFLDNISVTRWFYMQKGFLYYTGCVRQNGNKQVGVFIKFKLNGDMIWQKTYSDAQEDVIPQRVNGSSDGGFLLTGFFQNWTNHTNPCLLIKTDANGNELWRKKIHKLTPDTQDGRAIIQDTASKKIVIGGYQYIGNTNTWATYDNVLILDSLGNLLGRYNYTSRGLLHDLIQTKDKKIVAVGHMFYSQPNINTELDKSFALKFDLNSPVIPVWRLDNFDQASSLNYFTCISELPGGNLVVGGAIDTLLKYDLPKNELTRITTLSPNGVVLRNNYYNYKTNEPVEFFFQRPLCVYPTADKGLVAAIEPLYFSPNPFFIVKFDSTGCDSTLAYCAAVAAGISKNTTANGRINIYPNPAGSTLNIDLENADNDELTIDIIDLYGREVKRVQVEQANNSMDIKELAKGMYLLKIINNEDRILYQRKFFKE